MFPKRAVRIFLWCVTARLKLRRSRRSFPALPAIRLSRLRVTRVTKLIEERFTRDELYTADEAFFTGTAAELTPIREVDDRQIGAGRRGPVTEDIQNTFFDIIKGKNGRYEKWLAYV